MEYKKAVLEAKDLTFSYDGAANILEHLNVSIEEGKITVLMGANGCGKSTLFKLMTKNLVPDEGVVTLNGDDIDDLRLKEFARSVAIVHQNNTAPPDLTVEKLVRYGRTPYLSAFQTAGGREDDEAVEWAVKVTNIRGIRHKSVAELSGGQRQRVWIAMALAQMTNVLFLDEPTTYLDIRYQIEILQLIRSLNREFGITIIMVLHDINQAMEYGDVFVGMKDGQITVEGNPREVVDSGVLYDLYGINLPVAEAAGKKFVLTV
ncbi:MAG: ABC transporter ATP-binding protein [Clostridiales bacterium]|nr:ABC transporter ATP-binding protein [Clostridiales bacterium]